jgi:hypothetical protein
LDHCGARRHQVPATVLKFRSFFFLIKEHDSGLNNSTNCLQPHQEHRSNYAAPNNHQTHTSTPRLQQTAHMFTLLDIFG